MACLEVAGHPLHVLTDSADIMQLSADAPKAREALKLLLSPEGQFFREFITNEVVLSVDAMSRKQLAALVARLGLAGISLPVLLPGASLQW